MMAILVIAKAKDIHTSYVVEKLELAGEKVYLLEYAKFPQQIKISFRHDGDCSGLIFEFENGETLKSKDIKSVYNRRQESPKAHKGLKSRKVKEYIVRESQYFLDALPKVLNAFWFSNQDSIINASCKPYQLIQAQKVGFKTPDTIITNSGKQVLEFAEESDLKEIAIKSLNTPGFISGHGRNRMALAFYTQKVNRRELPKLALRAQNCPTTFQPYIEKDFELRITVVGEKIFPCAIHSQKAVRTKYDWRKYDIPNTPHEVFKLPIDVEMKCLSLIKNLGLVFGCIDMIVTPNGEYVFLEVNPNGQWLWVEKLTGFPIGDSIVDALVRGKSDI